MCLPTRTPILMVVVIRVVFVLQNLAKMRLCSLVLSSNFSNCCRDQFVGRTIGEEFKFLELQSSFRSVWRRQRAAQRSCDLPWRRVRNDVWLIFGRRTRNHCVQARGKHWIGWIVYPIQPVTFDPFSIGLGFDLKFWFGYGHQSNAMGNSPVKRAGPASIEYFFILRPKIYTTYHCTLNHYISEFK